MSDRIAKALTKLFDRHRIIFWYDTKHELRGDFEALSLNGVEKLELTKNEFNIKYRMLREQPKQKFLIYHEGPQPSDIDNWLLDVQLAHGEFRTDQVAIWLSELELSIEFIDLVQSHAEFFQAVKRRESLKTAIRPDDTVGAIRLKMLAVCCNCDARIDAVIESLLQDLADDREEKFKLIQRSDLDSFLWDQLLLHYGYKSDTPGVQDFAIELFKSCFAMGTDSEFKLTTDALVFLKRWKDNRKYTTTYEQLSSKYAEVLGIEQDLVNRDFRNLMEMDYFKLIEQKIISDLVREVSDRTVSSGDVALWVRQRRQSYWYPAFSDLYEAIDYAAQFIHTLGHTKLEMNDFVEGIQRYSQIWYQLDQFYRKFIFHVRKSGKAPLMSALSEQIENLYSNNYLLKLGDTFQHHVEKVEQWDASPIPLQKNFFERWVRPFVHKDIKVCVIISDAMRYEIGDELLSLIRQEDRYSAELEPALSMLPSYTQLGMAALLPNKTLSIADNESGTVLVDGQSSMGTSNRKKILNSALEGAGHALTAEEFLEMNRDDSRELLKINSVVYIYHNRIDHTGDKIQSEGRAFDAAEETLDDLLRLVKKLTAANANNILITADHGFIYQHRAIEESDFSSVDIEGKTLLYRDRRFVLGKGLKDSSSSHGFDSSQLGLTGDVEVRIPKSINRLRLKGSGSRFVHGGASLQEIVIPVIKINKSRKSDVSSVEVDILRGTSSVITSGQLAVTLYQSGPVTDKIQPRSLRAGIYSESGELISDCHELTFDLTSENPRERELQVRFVLTREADVANGKEVILKLEERHAGTSHYKEYKSLRYLMRRSFTSDFDF